MPTAEHKTKLKLLNKNKRLSNCPQPQLDYCISLQKSFKQFRSGLLFTTSSISGPALNLHIMSLPLCSRLSSRLWPRKTFYLNKLQEALRSCRYINMDEQFQEISRFHLPWMFFSLQQFNYVINVKGSEKQVFFISWLPKFISSK